MDTVITPTTPQLGAGTVPSSRFLTGLSFWTLAYTLGVIVWGAYVRATGSGAGCGEHWPLCNGTVLPRSPQLATAIEFTHRLTSGVNLILVVAMGWVAIKASQAGTLLRRAGIASILLIFTEALIGAGLVLLGLVAENQSYARAISLALHLINTFLLVGAITATWTWSRYRAPVFKFPTAKQRWGARVALLGLIAVGVTGAVAALGDTLFPGTTDSFSATAHILIRLRVWHPVFAVAVSAFLLFYSQSLREHRMASAVGGLTLAQVALGLINVTLLAPVWAQLVHLLLADLLWISLVLLVLQSATREKLGK